ncbi:MAG: DUF5683 domain-containing protein [Bacteroidota bacterium]
MKNLIVLCFLISSCATLCAQQSDSIALAIDSLERKERVVKPGAALKWSLIPGGGQIYNRRWWKLPLVYGGLFGTIGYAEFYNNNFQRMVTALEAECFGDGIPDECMATTHEFTGVFDVQAMRTLRDRFDQRRQYAYLYIALVYLLQAVEAYTDAQLMDFDMDDNLSAIRIVPNLTPQQGMGMGIAIPLGSGLRLKRQEAVLKTVPKFGRVR